MSMQLETSSGDFTSLQDTHGQAADVPIRHFSLTTRDDQGLLVALDEHSVIVPANRALDLVRSVLEKSIAEMRSAQEKETAFRPLNRILMHLSTTPVHQLFLSCFHISSLINLFDKGSSENCATTLRSLFGDQPWPSSKKGHLYFLRDEEVPPGVVADELVANGKIFSATLSAVDNERNSILTKRWFIPYATPIDFNTNVSNSTREVWRQLSHRIGRERGFW